MKNATTVTHTSERELTISRVFNGPARLVYEAWTTPDLLKRWWAPRSSGMSLIACEVDARAGGAYRFVFGVDGAERMTFFGRYLEVTPGARLVWTNEESGHGGAVTTVTFEERDGATMVTVRELYPSEEAFKEATGSGMEGGTCEQHEQLDELLVILSASAMGGL